nr:hypothetical protein [Tanacetum cinerariifolium]
MTRVPNKKVLVLVTRRVANASNITMNKDVDPMLDNIRVPGRCISLWHSHRLNEAHNPYSIDMVLQDSQNSRIQIYIKNEWMFRFEPLFKEGECYSISNFSIAENRGKLPLLPHKYMISFYKGTVVTRIDPFDENLNGFILEPFNCLLDGTRHYHEHEAVDVIGSVVAIGDVIPVQSAAGRKIQRTVVIEDSENELGHVVFILQLGKVKYWDGTPSIHNALFGTKMFINRDFPEIQAFRQRFKELPEYDENQFKIYVFTPQNPVVTIAEFFHGAVKKTVSSICECEQAICDLETTNHASFNMLTTEDYIDHGDPTFECSSCGALLWYAESMRGATNTCSDTYSLCCGRGKVTLTNEVLEPPPLLKKLITNKHPKSESFIDNIRRYNSMFSFTSMGGKQDTSVNVGQGPYCYRLHGENYPLAGPLLPVDGKPANNGESSSSRNNELDYQLTTDIRDLLDEINQLVQDYRMAGEHIRSSDDEKISLRLIVTRQQDGRQYNLPTTSEVAALIVGDFDFTEHKRDIILHCQDGDFKTSNSRSLIRKYSKENSFLCVHNGVAAIVNLLSNASTRLGSHAIEVFERARDDDHFFLARSRPIGAGTS